VLADSPSLFVRRALWATDTTNATDNVVGQGALAGYTVTTARTSDGAMLASKVLAVDV
jgi:hypothetical protein